jgi:hypothetical protein
MFGCSAAKLNRLKTCQYKYSGISDVIVSGQKLEDLKIDKKPGFMGTSVLGKLLFEKEAPMTFNVLILVTNPNKKVAALDKIEWTAFVQGKELLSGIYNQHFEVKPGETATLSIPVSFDLKEKIMGENGAAVKMFGMAYLMNGSSKGLSIKVRPYVGGVKFPEAFEIKQLQK